ncbi:hypothetical protein BJ878DRAFT_194917 [Calycina marina]|uniref:Uncharacterized protein n=1 Tax=Calycina marina TaxID=1763456 RepID=A0A9P7Z9C8_9HELO|nr:hypothetical protein BJ878DRAFT_194917 [Calycina marina]
MNRFRTKKKAKDASEGLGRSSNDSDAPPSVPVLKPSKTFRLGGRKQPEPEPKLELDVANALPPSDDFRTSLLMSGLSARFSMLREQDDPKSKIGKASDDSVLFPSKRQSRMNDFGYASYGLSDIAEVSSINGSIRPPFAKSRTDSFGSENTDGGSIMNRAKPGEGNNLFGGRQKVYKISMNYTGSTKNLADGAGSGGMGGRALYEDDVSMSAFQKLREREREEERERAKQQLQDSIDQDDSTSNPQYRSASPPLAGYNRNRETSSTTSSAGPSMTRSSTAATSFTSQRTPSLKTGAQIPISPSSAHGGMERSTTKSRRLYDNGLDQHLNEQQSSAMSRIDTLTRQRPLGAQTPPPGVVSPTGPPSATDRWDRHQLDGKASMPNMRTTSPSPTLATRGNFDFGVRPNLVTERVQAFGATSQLAPPVNGDDENVLPLQPNDRGKATALGAFFKPAQPYDENQYSQRQIQMQQGRSDGETLPHRKNSPPRAFVPRQRLIGRPRGDSNPTFTSASARSRSNSSAQRQFLPHDRVPEHSVLQLSDAENSSSNTGTFLNSSISSTLGSPHQDSDGGEVQFEQHLPMRPMDLYNKYRQEQPTVVERPPESEHPALREATPESRDLGDASPIMGKSMPRLHVEPSPATSVKSRDHIDSPTLGPTTGLSSMIHQHMRVDSNASSIYGGSTYGGLPSSGLVSRFPAEPTEPVPQIPYNSGSNPWDRNDWDAQSDYGDNDNNFELEALASPKPTSGVVPLPLNPRSPNIETANESRKTSWEKDLDAHHMRNDSSDTQKEQDDFKMDLAARRRRVQENLKSFVETDSRSASPAHGGLEWSKDSQSRSNPFGILKSKTSRSSIARTSKEGQSKAMKMLGIGSTTISSSPSPGKSDFDDHQWKQEEEDMLRGTKIQAPSLIAPTAPVVAPQTKAFRQARRDAQRDREKQTAVRRQQRLATEGEEQNWANNSQIDKPRQRIPMRDNVPPNICTRTRSPSHERRPSPRVAQHSARSIAGQEKEGYEGKRPGFTSSSRPRDRSRSDASGRSKSRTGRHTDDLARSMTDRMSNSSRAFPEGLNPPPTQYLPRSPNTTGMPYTPSPAPSPMDGTSPATRNSSSSKSGYFDGQRLQPLQTADGVDIGLSPRPPPVTPYFANTTPSLVQPSPAGSRATTPIVPGMPVDARVPGTRKRSIVKADISEPKFISSTSRVTTVDLAPGVSLQSRSDSAPPIPAVNPRRRTRAMFGFGKKEDFNDYTIPAATQSTEEMDTFSGEDTKPRGKGRLRKISSEGGNMNLRAKQATNAMPSPAAPVPSFPVNAGSKADGKLGEMF